MTLTDLLELLKQRRMCSNDMHLARLLGVTPSTLSHYRRGVRRPSLEHCDDLARLLEIDVDEVVALARGRAKATR
jgi:transcriptional regulator with XRE-family HTH domain